MTEGAQGLVEPKAKTVIGCVGMTTIDTILFAERLPVFPDDLVGVLSGATSLGGKGVLTALALSELGCETLLLTLLGSGDATHDQLVGRLMDTLGGPFILPWLNTTSRTWITLSPTQEAHTFVAVGSILDNFRVYVDDICRCFLTQVDMVYLTASEDLLIITAMLSVLKALGKTVVLNASSALIRSVQSEGLSLLWKLIEISDTIILNQRESAQMLLLLGIASWGDLTCDRPRQIIVTCGELGGFVLDRTSGCYDTFHAPAVTDVRCVVGAGDTFNAAYMKARYIDGLEALESCQFASTVAVQNTCLAGTSAIGFMFDGRDIAAS